MLDPWMAWTILIIGWVLPMLHIALAPSGGSWLPPPGSGCPLGPRVGWLVLVLLTGPLGWLAFRRARRRMRSPGMPDRELRS